MTKKRLGEMLLEAGVIDEAQLHAALGHQRKWGGKLGQALLDLKLASEPQIVGALARKFGYDVAPVATLPRTPQVEAAMKLVPRELALRQMLLPIASDTTSLTVAMADPSNIAVVDELSFRTGRRIRIVLAGDREIAAAVRRLYYAEERPPAIALDDGPVSLETTRDPFAAMPDYIRDGFFNQPALGAASRPPPVPRPRTTPGPDLTPPPVLGQPPGRPPAGPVNGPSRGPGAPVRPTPARPLAPAEAVREIVAAFAPRGAEQQDALGEPILATDLALEPVAAVPGAQGGGLTPKQAALLDAIERLARGEESALVRPGQLAAALARLLVQRGVLSWADLADELLKR